MITALRYSLEEDGIRIDMPQPAFDEANEQAEYFAHIIDHPQLGGIIETEPMDGGTRLLLNTKRAGMDSSEFSKEKRLRALTYVATMASAYTDLDRHDPDVLYVNMSLDTLGDGTRYGMDAAINRWTAPYYEAQEATNKAMGQTALNLGYMSKRLRESSVYARIDTERGVTLETNPAGSCSLDTDGSEYSSEDEIVFLHGHNVYSRQMQLILLSGVIALAKS